MFIIVKHFIPPAVETEKDNIEYWAKVFFMDCKARKQPDLLGHNDLAALPKDELVAVTSTQYLLKKHADRLIDEMAQYASADSH
jgi:hypothetical protein